MTCKSVLMEHKLIYILSVILKGVMLLPLGLPRGGPLCQAPVNNRIA